MAVSLDVSSLVLRDVVGGCVLHQSATLEVSIEKPTTDTALLSALQRATKYKKIMLGRKLLR